jgi:serine/threonine protein kinase
MSWPTPQDYNEALQHPGVSFRNADLKKGVAEVNALGLPKPTSGAFASVYRMHCGSQDWAVRCFLHDIPDQHDRYTEISKFILSDDLDFTVDCEFLKEGILIAGRWHPILKMQWVDGSTLGEYLESRIANHDSSAIEKLVTKFERAVQLMQKNGIAHGDLQHGNILVLPNGDLRLVDYDGMFVPSLQGWGSNELGHRNYQHPARTRDHFGPYLDNFSAWVIYLSLMCIAIDPTLWTKVGGGDDCLLFRQRDYVDPKRSHVFRLLAHHASVDIRKAASMFESMLCEVPDRLPGIEALGPDAQGRNFGRPSLFDRMIWSVKSLSFRVPDWLHDLKHDDSDSSSSLESVDNHTDDRTHGGLPSWLSGIVGEHKNANENISSVHASGTASSQNSTSQPASLNQTNKLPDWLDNSASGMPSAAGANASVTSGHQTPPPSSANASASATPATPTASKRSPSIEAQAKKMISEARSFSLQHRYKDAERELAQLLLLVPERDLKLHLEVLVALALTHAQHGDELFLGRSSIAAMEQYEKSLACLDDVSRLRGGIDAVADLMTKADVLNQLVTVYERCGRFSDSKKICARYIAVLNNLPQTTEKLKRAKNRLKDLIDSTGP